MSDPTLSDIDFKNKMTWLWTTLKGITVTKKSLALGQNPKTRQI